jgi:hypothetical protein
VKERETVRKANHSRRRVARKSSSSWREVTETKIRTAVHETFGEFPQAEHMLAQLLACGWFWRLLEFRVNEDQARRDQKFSTWANMSLEAVKDLRDTDEYRAVAGLPFAVVRFTQELLLVAVVARKPSKDLSRVRERLRTEQDRHDSTIKKLGEIKQSLDDPELAHLMGFVLEEVKKKRNRIPMDPDSIAPRGGAATFRSVVFKEIGKRIPETYAAAGTEIHQRTIEDIARALGVLGITRDTYRDLFKRST